MSNVLPAYAKIDPIIDAWVKRHSLSLCREWQGEARFWYASRGNECFPIAIDRPAGRVVTIRSRSIETDDDVELSGEWTVNLKDLEQALTTATALIDLWAARARLVS